LNAAVNLRIVFTFILLFESGLLRRNLIVLGGASEDEQRGNQREEGRGKSHKGHSITIFGFSPQEKNSAALRLNRLRRARSVRIATTGSGRTPDTPWAPRRLLKNPRMSRAFPGGVDLADAPFLAIPTALILLFQGGLGRSWLVFRRGTTYKQRRHEQGQQDGRESHG
jgi:hypothetical protein